MEISRKTAQGVPMYFYPNPHLHSFCLCMYIRAGSMYEKKEENGITHFYEHIVIRNINSLMKGTFYQELDRLGLTFNGATYKEFVQFSISGASSHTAEAIDLFLKLLDPIVLSEEEIRTEKRRVYAELRECGKKKSIENRMERLVWKGSTLRREIAGKKKILKKIGKKELAVFRLRMLEKENLFFYGTGCWEEAEMELLNRKLAGICFPKNRTEALRTNIAPVPTAFQKRGALIRFHKAKTTQVSVSFDFAAEKYSDAMICLFGDLLFVGDYCRIYQELSEKTGYIYSYDDKIERYRNIGTIQLTYEVTEKKLLPAIKKMLEIFAEMKHDPGNLDFVRAIYVDNGRMVLDDAEEFNWNRAYDCHILEERYPDIETKTKAFQSVTQEEMKKMAREIFRPENMVMIVQGKKKKLPEKQIGKLVRLLEDKPEKR